MIVGVHQTVGEPLKFVWPRPVNIAAARLMIDRFVGRRVGSRPLLVTRVECVKRPEDGLLVATLTAIRLRKDWLDAYPKVYPVIIGWDWPEEGL